MFLILCAAAAVSAAAAIAADWNERRHKSFYLLKPLTTLLIAGIALQGPAGDYRTLVIIGLLLSCAGDICLMFTGDTVPERSEAGAGAGGMDAIRTHLLTQDTVTASTGNRWFIGGLSSFLLAHVLFVAAYLAGVDLQMPPVWTAAFLVYGVAIFGWLLPKTGSLKLPVIVYGTVLMSMAIAASLRWVQLPGTAALLAMLGAAIFVVSDSALAVRKFNGPYRGAQALILSTYWLAIGLIAASAVI